MSVIRYEAPKDRHIDIFSGARNWVKLGKDNCIYVLTVGEINRDKFQIIGFRIHPNGNKEWLPFPGGPIGRNIDVTEWHGKAFVSWHDDDKRTICTMEVPGYVAIEFDGAVSPPIDPIELPENVVHMGVDEEGREYTTKVKKELHARIGQVEQSLLDKLTEIVVEMSNRALGLTTDDVKNIIWNTSTTEDRIYVALKNRDSGIAKEIGHIADEHMVTAAIDRNAVKELVKEVLIEILTTQG